MTYLSPKVAKPESGRKCIVIVADGRPMLAVFHARMGDPKAGGDFASITYTKRGMELNHLPGVLMWEEIRCPTEEEFNAAVGGVRP